MASTWPKSIFVALGLFLTLFNFVSCHPMATNKNYKGENPRWRPFNSFDGPPKNRILPIAYMTMNEDENPVHPAILHGLQYVSNIL